MVENMIKIHCMSSQRFNKDTFKGRIFQTYVLKVRVQKEQSLCSKAEGKGQQTVLCGPKPMEGAMLDSIPEAQESPSGRKLPSGSPAVTKYKILEKKKNPDMQKLG